MHLLPDDIIHQRHRNNLKALLQHLLFMHGATLRNLPQHFRTSIHTSPYPFKCVEVQGHDKAPQSHHRHPW